MAYDNAEAMWVSVDGCVDEDGMEELRDAFDEAFDCTVFLTQDDVEIKYVEE